MIVRSWLWRTYKEKKSELWLICDICDNCVCPKCFSKGLEKNDDFCCNRCSAGDI